MNTLPKPYDSHEDHVDLFSPTLDGVPADECPYCHKEPTK